MSATWRELWREVDLDEKCLGLGTACVAVSLSAVLVAVVLRVGGVAGEWPFVVASVPAFIGAGFLFAALAVQDLYRRRERRAWKAKLEEKAARTYWQQVAALHFRKVEEVPGGWLVLEDVFHENSPAGRLAAKDFARENVSGARVLHTREVKS